MLCKADQLAIEAFADNEASDAIKSMISHMFMEDMDIAEKYFIDFWKQYDQEWQQHFHDSAIGRKFCYYSIHIAFLAGMVIGKKIERQSKGKKEEQ